MGSKRRMARAVRDRMYENDPVAQEVKAERKRRREARKLPQPIKDVRPRIEGAWY